MRKRYKHNSHILALHVTSRGFGYAIIENLNNLVDWGVVELHRKYALQHILDTLQKLSRRYNAFTIVVQAILDKTGRTKRARKFVNALKTAYWPIQLIEITSSKIHNAFPKCSNKYDRAREICSLFPFLLPFLPAKRRFYSAEHYRMSYFDAICLGVSCFQPI